jgi:hypothetical protein
MIFHAFVTKIAFDCSLITKKMLNREAVRNRVLLSRAESVKQTFFLYPEQAGNKASSPA